LLAEPEGEIIRHWTWSSSLCLLEIHFTYISPSHAHDSGSLSLALICGYQSTDKNRSRSVSHK